MIWEVGGEIRRLPASIETPAPPIVVNRKLKEIGGIKFEPWLTRPFCDALRNMHAGQLV